MTKKQATSFGSIFIISAALLWAFDGVLRRSLFDLPPLVIVFAEHALGGILIAPFALPLLAKEKFKPIEWLALVWIAFFSGLMGTFWFTKALVSVNFIPFSVVFLLQKLQPIFATATAVVLLKEKISRNYLQWAVLAVIAAFFVTFPNGSVNFETGQGTIMAALLATGAAFAWGSSTAVSRFTLLHHSNTVITGLRFWLTSLFGLVAIIFMNQLPVIATISQDHLLRLSWIAISTGMFALWLYYKGLKQVEAKVSTILELVFPATAVLIDMFLYQSFLQPSQYVAGVILLFAVYQTSKTKS